MKMPELKMDKQILACADYRGTNYSLYVMPSTNEGYYYVTVVTQNSDERKKKGKRIESGCHAEGLSRPIRAEGVEMIVNEILRLPQAEFDVMELDINKQWDYNPWLFNSKDDSFNKSVLGKY